MKSENKIAIIPARSGSKGLKDKNIKMLNHKPLLAYSIEAAIASDCFDEIFVSTDSEQYAEIARKYGASIPFLRSRESATDTASTWDMVKEILEKYKKRNNVFDVVTLLQPTSPLRTSEDIINGFHLFYRKNAMSVVSICETEHSPVWSFTLPDNHSLEEYGKQSCVTLNRQSLPAYYRENGALYLIRCKHLFEVTNIYDESCFAYIMPRERSVDIDNITDFHLAEFLLNQSSSKL